MLKRMIARFIPALAFSAIVSPAVAQQNPLKVLIIKNSLPMSYHDEDGKWVGFYLDMAQALCAAMKTPCEFKETLLSDIVDKVSSGEGDIGIAGLSMTPERAKKVLFSDPYQRGKNFWVSKKPINDSRNLRVAVVKGSAADAWATKKQAENAWTIVTVKVNADLQNTLFEGQADAAIVPGLTIVDFVDKQGFTKAGYNQQPLDELNWPVGLAVNPNKADLRDKVNAALREIKGNGQLDAINSKYFKFRIF